MMSEPARFRQPVDLDEFERRLRVQQRAGQSPADPLTELARLVEGGADARSAAVSGMAGYEPPAENALPQRRGTVRSSISTLPFARHRAAPLAEASAPAPNPAVAPAANGNWEGDLARWEAEMRAMAAAPAQPSDSMRYDPHTAAAGQSSYAAEPQFQEQHAPEQQYDPSAWQDDGEGVPAYADEVLLPRRSRRSLYLMGGALAAVVAMIGTTFAFRGSPLGPREIPLIKASATPVKIKPEVAATANSATRSLSLLDKPDEHLATSRVVSSEEQPVDISQVAAAPAAFAPADARQPPASEPSPGFFPEPKRVKTVSVRPDGTIISGSDRQAAQPIASTTPVAPAPLPRPASLPVAAAPAHPASVTPATPRPAATSKSTARIATTPKTLVARADASDTPVDLNTAARPVPPGSVPNVDGRTAVASVAPHAAAASAGAGGFSVQLASAGSTAEAHAKAVRLQAQFAALLGGRRAGVVKGEVRGRTVYRVRVSGLSHEDATSLCVRLKSSGGECFVAR
jgi:hypothetical protein